MKIAITVTFNSSHTLALTIQALLKQTLPLDRIIVVDNASADEHYHKVLEICNRSSNIVMLRLKKNTGGAGGFYEGMKYALEHYDPDWYWLMDDDAYPEDDCLEKLLQYETIQENVGCLAPLIYGIDLNEYQLYHHKKLSKLLVRDMPIANNIDDLKEITPIEADAFVGPLFSRLAVKTVGIADKDLFIYGDDLEYTFRVSRQFPVLLVKNAIINHKDPLTIKEKSNPAGWWKDYYKYRNRILFVREFQSHSLLRITAQSILVGKILIKIFQSFIFSEYKGLRRLRCSLLGQALKDGVRNKKGATLQPDKYRLRLDEFRTKK